MKKTLLLYLFCLPLISFAQKTSPDSSWKKQYRAVETKNNDLVHIKLEAKFDYEKSQMAGQAWVTLHPHFYSTNTLDLDAKYMSILEVSLFVNEKRMPLKYSYDSLALHISLDKTYDAKTNYTVFISYITTPAEAKKEASDIINTNGIYFINPKGKTPGAPTQIWTQGEPEFNSNWIPIIDKPNQKTTQDFYLTVPQKYLTVSNGKLADQKTNSDGTRTDHWSMELPHAPYLMFMGVGEYAVIKDSYKDKEVSYYVEKEYSSVARRIFGKTPEMIAFFSRITGIDFPWNKYTQITARNLKGGGMENTSSTVFSSGIQLNARDLSDGNFWENTIAHELFHQWFGDLVTTESWSNLTMNEGFGNYGEILWYEYHNGAEVADEARYNYLQDYISINATDKPLIRFYYPDADQLFNAVSYNKGGSVLHMLRHLVGDSAFFRSLNHYLTVNKFGTGTARKLQLSFETITGTDLNWFWDQWFFANGHPEVEISYSYDETKHLASVFIKQQQQGPTTYKLPLDIDIYEGANKKRYTVWMTNRSDSFTFNTTRKPDLINVDGDKILLWDKTDQKTVEEFAFQYNNARTYIDRRETIDYASAHKNEPAAFALLKSALRDPYAGIRRITLEKLVDTVLDTEMNSTIEQIALSDSNKFVRGRAVDVLAKTKDKKYLYVYEKGVKDSSYALAGSSLKAIDSLDAKRAEALVPMLKNDAKWRLKIAVRNIEARTMGDADFEEMTTRFTNEADANEKYIAMMNYTTFLCRVNNTEHFKKGIDNVLNYRDELTIFDPTVKPDVNRLLSKILSYKTANKEQSLNKAENEIQIAYVNDALKGE